MQTDAAVRRRNSCITKPPYELLHLRWYGTSSKITEPVSHLWSCFRLFAQESNRTCSSGLLLCHRPILPTNQLSIKSLERKKRAGCGEIRLKPTRRDQKTPSQFKKFLANSQNKLDLVRFLIEDWSTNPCHIDAIGIREIYATIEEEAFLIKLYNGVPGKERVAALESSQEEADTKVFLCAQFATTLGINSITIITVDSDIGILALFYSLYLPSQIVLQLGSASTIRYLDISATTLSEELGRALPWIPRVYRMRFH